jgi:hypothetical protein
LAHIKTISPQKLVISYALDSVVQSSLNNRGIPLSFCIFIGINFCFRIVVAVGRLWIAEVIAWYRRNAHRV